MKVFIGCGSSETVESIYYDKACEIATCLSCKGYDLICGSCTGVMTEVLKIFDCNFRNVCIYETACYQKDSYNYDFQLFRSIKERKDALIVDADLIVFLPGGIGTYDEFFTSIELNRAGEIDKKIIIVNINGYYDRLLSMLEKMYDEHFAGRDDKTSYIVVKDMKDFIKVI